MTDKFVTEVWLVDKEGTRAGKLADAQVQSIKWKLNDDGEGEVTFHPLLESAPLFKTAEQETQVWVNGELRWWGVNEHLGGSSKQLTASLPGLGVYFADRWIVLGDRSYGTQESPLEQMTIGAQLVEYAQDDDQGTNPDLNIGIDTFIPSGVQRYLTYEAKDAKNIRDALRDFATYSDGFSWDITYTGDGARFWTPRVLAPATKAVYLEYGREITEYEWEEIGTIITRLRMLGGTPHSDNPEEDAPEQLIADVEDEVASAQFGVRFQVVTGNNDATVNELAAQAELGVSVRNHSIVVTSITVKNTQLDIFEKDIKCGDALHFKIDHGRVQVNGTSQILGIDWNPKTTKFTFVGSGS